MLTPTSTCQPLCWCYSDILSHFELLLVALLVLVGQTCNIVTMSLGSKKIQILRQRGIKASQYIQFCHKSIAGIKINMVFPFPEKAPESFPLFLFSSAMFSRL